MLGPDGAGVEGPAPPPPPPPPGGTVSPGPRYEPPWAEETFWVPRLPSRASVLTSAMRFMINPGVVVFVSRVPEGYAEFAMRVPLWHRTHWDRESRQNAGPGPQEEPWSSFTSDVGGSRSLLLCSATVTGNSEFGPEPSRLGSALEWGKQASP